MPGTRRGRNRSSVVWRTCSGVVEPESWFHVFMIKKPISWISPHISNRLLPFRYSPDSVPLHRSTTSSMRRARRRHNTGSSNCSTSRSGRPDAAPANAQLGGGQLGGQPRSTDVGHGGGHGGGGGLRSSRSNRGGGVGGGGTNRPPSARSGGGTRVPLHSAVGQVGRVRPGSRPGARPGTAPSTGRRQPERQPEERSRYSEWGGVGVGVRGCGWVWLVVCTNERGVH